MKPRFSVSFEIVTPESAESGDADSSGWITQSVGLRDALTDLCRTRTAHCDGIESFNTDERSLCVINGMEFRTGAQESRTLHPDSPISWHSMQRILRIVRGR